MRADSRYNRDNAYVTSNSSDQLAVIVKTGAEGCLQYEALVEADRLAWELQQLPSVQTTVFLGNAVRQITAGSNEGNPKCLALARNQNFLNYGARQASANNPDLFNNDCSVMPVIDYLTEHRAESLSRVVDTAARFAEQHSVRDRQFLLAAGSAGRGGDYALYLLSIQLAQQRDGASRGGLLAAGVVTWVWSPIKFQADNSQYPQNHLCFAPASCLAGRHRMSESHDLVIPFLGADPVAAGRPAIGRRGHPCFCPLRAMELFPGQ